MGRIKLIDKAKAIRHARLIEGLCRNVILATKPLDTEQAQIGCMIVGLLFDGYRSLLSLLESGADVHAPTIARSLLESFADLRALVDDPRFAKRMKLHAAKERRKAVAGYVEQYHASPEFEASTTRARSDLADLERIVASLEKEGTKDYSVSDCFRLAGLDGEKAYVYGELCSFAHADFIAIYVRHVGQDNIRLGAPLPDEWFAKSLFLSTTAVLDGVYFLQVLASGYDAKLDALRDKAILEYRQLPLVDKIVPE